MTCTYVHVQYTKLYITAMQKGISNNIDRTANQITEKMQIK